MASPYGQPTWDTHYQRRGRNREHYSYERGEGPRRSQSADSRPQYATRPPQEFKESSYYARDGFFCREEPSNRKARSDVGVPTGHRNDLSTSYDRAIRDDSVLYSRTNRKLNWGDLDPPLHGEESYIQLPQGDRRQDRNYYDYAKDHLITFGHLNKDAPSASTGLSQEELLQRKRKEETLVKRKEKRKGRNRILNFPTGLLMKSSGDDEDFYDHQYSQRHSPLVAPSHTMHSRTSEMAQHGSSREDRRSVTIQEDPYSRQEKGVRASMVRRQRDKARKSQLTSCYSTNAVQENTPVSTRRETRVKGETTSRLPSQNSNYAPTLGNTQFDEYQPPKDNFERFMEHPNLLPNQVKEATAFDRQSDNTDHDYLSVARILDNAYRKPVTGTANAQFQNINNRPMSANFTPKSEYTPRNGVFGYTKETSPTSVMDLGGTRHNNCTTGSGVRWNEKLTQQHYILSPQSTTLRNDTHHAAPQANYSVKPKSILRSKTRNLTSPAIDESTSHFTNAELKFSNGFQQELSPFSTKGDSAVGPGWSDAVFEPGFADPEGFPESPFSMVPPNGGGESNGNFPESYVNFIEAVACVVIQTKIRQTLAKNRVRRMKWKRETTTASTMTPMVRKSYALAKKARLEKQKRGRALEAKNNRDKNAANGTYVAMDFYALAAIQIQAAFRGWWVRDCLGVDNYCAMMIQKTYRGMRDRHNYNLNLYRIVQVQSVCRRWLAMDAVVTRVYCIVRIQAFLRGCLVRTRLRFDAFENDVYEAAATLIQTQWRSFASEMKFLRAYEDILVVQSIIRGWMARKQVRALKQKSRKRPTSFRKTSRFLSNTDQATRYTNYRKKHPDIDSKPQKSLESTEHLESSSKPESESHVVVNPWRSKPTQKQTGTAPRSKFYASTDQNKLLNENENIFVKKALNHRVGAERRRKEKKEEVEADREKENQRLEIQTKQMSEIELRRKQMAMKAQARKKEAASLQVNPKTSDESRLQNDAFHYHEEKKLDNGSFEQETRKGSKASHIGLSTGKAVSRQAKKNVVAKPIALEVAEFMNPTKDPVPFNEKGESLIARRKRELKLNNSNLSSTEEEGWLPMKETSKLSGRNTAEEETDEKQNSTSKAAALDKQNAIQDLVNENDSSATLPTQIQVELESSLTTTRTTGTYQHFMRSIRSESEQQRIHKMHIAFQKAGLFSRVKHSNQSGVQIEDGSLLERWH